MSETTTGTPATFNTGPRPADGDLSRDVERHVAKLPLDRVRCVRVFGDYYRCNWWAPPLPAGTSAGGGRTIAWGTGATHHVRQSKFLIATTHEGALRISEVNR